MFILAVVLVVVLLIGAAKFIRPRPTPNPNALEPDVFANEDADLDPESDTGEPEGWN